MSTRPPPAPPAAPAAPTSGANGQVRSPRATLPTLVPLAPMSGVIKGARKAVVYGTGGAGKSTLAAHLPAPYFFDCEIGSNELNVTRDRVSSWIELRGKLASLVQVPPDGMRSVVVDTSTSAQQFATEHVIATRTTEKGSRVESIEGFGWGKGWKFVHEEFQALLADLDRLVAKGFNVCLIAHQTTAEVRNADGENFDRWEPDLYSGDKKGNASVRELVKNWADYVLFMRYDYHVKDGKGIGSGTRSIYTQELPTHVAKSRAKQFCISFDINDPARAWRELEIS